jgi:dihydroorotase
VQEAAAPFQLPVMIHIGQSVSLRRAILPLLKRGDIVTHMYAPAPNGMLDDTGRVLPEVLAVRRRGIWCDFGNGRVGHVTWEVAERAMQQGFVPDTISTDWTPQGRPEGVIDLPHVLSKFLLLGMPLMQVIACATVNTARVFAAFHDRGTLHVGALADVAVLELREGMFACLDNYNGTRTGHQRLLPSTTVLGGKRVPPPVASMGRPVPCVQPRCDGRPAARAGSQQCRGTAPPTPAQSAGGTAAACSATRTDRPCPG